MKLPWKPKLIAVTVNGSSTDAASPGTSDNGCVYGALMVFPVTDGCFGRLGLGMSAITADLPGEGYIGRLPSPGIGRPGPMASSGSKDRAVDGHPDALARREP
jgi:hypothetical protein